jgi:hypothetical protein
MNAHLSLARGFLTFDTRFKCREHTMDFERSRSQQLPVSVKLTAWRGYPWELWNTSFGIGVQSVSRVHVLLNGVLEIAMTKQN